MKVKGYLSREVPKDMLFERVVIHSRGCITQIQESLSFKNFCEITEPTHCIEIFSQCEEQLILLPGRSYFSYKSVGCFPYSSSRNCNRIDVLIKRLDLVPFALSGTWNRDSFLLCLQKNIESKEKQEKCFLTSILY